MSGTGTAFNTANSFASLALETTRGTAAATPTYFPVSAPAMSPMITWLKDQALRGSPVSEYDEVAGVHSDDFDLKGFVYEDSFPILLRAILGGADTVTGAGPYVHTIGLANAASTGSQPPSVTGVLFDAANAFQITGSQMVSLDLSSGADKGLEWTGKFTGNPWTVLGSTPSSSWGTVPLIPSWNTTISIGGSSIGYIETLDLKIDRQTKPIYTEGQQGPYVVFAGPIAVSGSFSAVVATNADPFTIGGSAYALYRQQKATVLTFSNPNTTGSVALTMTSVQFSEPKRKVDGEYTKLDVNFTALADTTDATAGGYSPIKTVTTNSISSAYTGS